MRKRTQSLRASSRLLVCILLAAAFLLSAGCPALAADASSVSGDFSLFGKTRSWEYPYSDDFFRASPDVYNHKLAQLSLGMALSANRDEAHPDDQAWNLKAFLRNAGFDSIEADPYLTPPTADSIAYGLALKEIAGTSILACAVCGGNYTKEWASNFTVGDELRPVGFQTASLTVQAAIADYLERHPLSGRLVLWIVGFSRGGAVANITAADCTQSGVFDAVYAYTFATPRTTREPVPYPNIFCIMQKEDLIPKIPLADWGYQRYGTDLFFVSLETDTDCGALMDRAASVYREITGSEMVFNSEINYQLRTVLDYLLVLMPDSATYAAYLQPLVVDIMTNSDGTKDALQVLLEALQQLSVDDEAVGSELKAMRDYLGTLINIYYLRGGLQDFPARQWDPELGTTNLFNAHNPCEYLALLYSSEDPAELYSDASEYIRLVIYGKADVTISDGESLVKEIRADGAELVGGVEDPYSFPDAEWSKDKVVITLPADRRMTVRVTSTALLPQTISYTGFRVSGNTVRAEADNLYSYLLNKGDAAEIVTAVDGIAIEPTDSDYTDVSLLTEKIYSPTTAMRMENNSIIHLTISGIVNKLLFIIVLLLVELIVWIVLAVRGRKKPKKKNRILSLVWHGVNVAVFAILEVAMWYFIPILPLAKTVSAILVFLVLMIYAVKGCASGSKNWARCWTLILFLAVFMVLEGLYIGDFTFVKGLFLLIFYALFTAVVYFLLWKTKDKRKTVHKKKKA